MGYASYRVSLCMYACAYTACMYVPSIFIRFCYEDPPRSPAVTFRAVSNGIMQEMILFTGEDFNATHIGSERPWQAMVMRSD